MLRYSWNARPSRSPRAAVAVRLSIVMVLPVAIAATAHAAGPLPTGGQFVAGAGSINRNATSLTINQTSSRGVIDWNSFSIGSGNQVSINNGNGATLNRLTGGALSSILGTLSSTGSVYLINPQGIVISRSGVVSTGGRFVASTLDIGNDAFMNGDALTFSGTSNGTVVNLGKIASSGGDVFLIASNEVDNVGTISTPNGTAELAAGHTVLLHDSTDSEQVFVQNGSGGKVVNRGDIEAAQIGLQAADGNVYALAGNHSVLRAMGTKTRDGHVWLVAGTGRVWMDGTIEAHNADGSGGVVDTNAARLRIAGGPTVKASQWNITTPSFTIDGLAAPVFQNNLDRGTSISLQTTGAGGTTGDIDVAASIHWVGAASLTLGAYHSLTIEAAAYLKNCGTGNLTLRADAQGIDNGGSVTNYGVIDWSASRGIVGAFYDMNGGYKPGKLLANKTWTAPAYSGLITQITGYKLVNSLADLEKVNTDLSGNYALGRDIDASATSDGSYIPIGSNSAFTGQFDGDGHTIDALTVAGISGEAGPVNEGLFGTLGAGAVVRDLNVNANVSITADISTLNAAGIEAILAADNYGTILHVNTSGTVVANAYIYGGDSTTAGGLVGVNHGTIERSSSSASGNTGGMLGGLVGENDGLIAQSYASGTVRTAEDAGSGGPTSDGSPGGLVGVNNGTIEQSYATGAVSNACMLASCSAAGLVNVNHGTISESFSTGAVTGGQAIDSDGVPIGPENYGIAAVNDGTIAQDVYWNKDTTATAIGVGSGAAISSANGLTNAQMADPKRFSGWNFTSTGAWAMPAGGRHPILRWQLDPMTAWRE
ncbi:filamentous hemagglutinin N-terminal domain-containing protein [Trinickia sp. NRRL B-1857]|uniref:two-partner secretion domain-containing protein n=1 Tax=Trinickia sp. NRRL B-1857 TaxID=3162879 RepID=UPI003D2C5953